MCTFPCAYILAFELFRTPTSLESVENSALFWREMLPRSKRSSKQAKGKTRSCFKTRSYWSRRISTCRTSTWNWPRRTSSCRTSTWNSWVCLTLCTTRAKLYGLFEALVQQCSDLTLQHRRAKHFQEVEFKRQMELYNSYWNVGSMMHFDPRESEFLTTRAGPLDPKQESFCVQLGMMDLLNISCPSIEASGNVRNDEDMCLLKTMNDLILGAYSSQPWNLKETCASSHVVLLRVCDLQELLRVWFEWIDDNQVPCLTLKANLVHIIYIFIYDSLSMTFDSWFCEPFSSAPTKSSSSQRRFETRRYEISTTWSLVYL